MTRSSININREYACIFLYCLPIIKGTSVAWRFMDPEAQYNTRYTRLVSPFALEDYCPRSFNAKWQSKDKQRARPEARPTARSPQLSGSCHLLAGNGFGEMGREAAGEKER